MLGENGAGKSTLMKIIYGAVRPDEGVIRWNGRPVNVKNPEEARALGIAMVFQHFSLFDTLTVAENVWLGVWQIGDPGQGRRTNPRSGSDLRARSRPAAPGSHVVGRRTAAGRDRARAADQPAAPDPRRANVGAHPAGGREAVRDAAQAGRRRVFDSLHQSQARRDPRALPSLHRAARRKGHRASSPLPKRPTRASRGS